MSLEYNHQNFDSLVSLNDAIDAFDDSKAEEVLHGQIGQVFDRHPGTTDQFGIALVHRHFDMDSNEILVEHGSTSAPWPIPVDHENFMGGRISPRSWHFSGSSVPKAYEFGFARSDEEAVAEISDYKPFVEDLYEVLRMNNLTSVLGLQAITSNSLPPSELGNAAKYEKTFGRTNVVFDVNGNAMDKKEARTAMWYYKKGMKQGHMATLCFSGCICQRA